MNYRQAACNDCGGLARPPAVVERVRDHPTEDTLNAVERALERGGADEGLLVCAACSQVVRVDVTGEKR
jgi:hypothetical protein